MATARPRIHGTLLQTRVGRRMLGLFVLCALLPVAALAAVSYTGVARSLREQARDRVRVAAKGVGAELLARLLELESRLDFVTDAVRDGAAARVIHNAAQGRFTAVLVTGPGERIRSLVGSLPSLAALSARQAEHLQAGGTVVAIVGGADPQVLLGRRLVPGSRPSPVVWAAAAPEAIRDPLVGGVAVNAAGSLCVVQPDGTPVHCPPQGALREGLLAPALTGDSAAGAFSWGTDSRYLAGFWSLFLDHRYATPDWRIIVSEREANILAPLTRFRRTVPSVALLTLLIVGFLSTTQIRRSLEPLAALREGTERIARRQFDQAVAVRSGDEFGDLANAFNGMAGRLKEQFQEADRLHRALEQASADVQQREARLAAIFESAADAVVTVTESGTIESCNATAEAVFGYARDDIRGHSLTELFATTPGTGPGGLPTGPAASRGTTLQLAARRRDGSTFPAELAVSRADVNARPVYTVFLRDVSERKRSEQERERLEAQLRQAQKMETIGALAGGIAHDFNNILTPIIGNVELALAEAPPSSEFTADLDQALKAARRAKDLVRQILLFARRSEPRVETLDVASVVKEACKLLRASLPATIEIQRDVAPDVAPVLGDATQLHQVLMNLCTNAFHAMREKGGVLTVKLQMAPVGPDLQVQQPRLEGTRAVRLTVGDTGHGMSPDTLERLFEPFFTTKPAGEGTGLGMSIVHGIVANHGGLILVDSAPGAGTRFEIYLPATAPRDEAAVAAPGRGAVRGEGRILVVDDDAAVGRLVGRVLERFGYQVTNTLSPEHALALLQGAFGGFRLVITDQTMPGMTGLQLAQQLRQVRPDLPVILMTGYSELQSREDMASLGLKDVLIKPVEVEMLVATVSRVLAAARAASGGDSPGAA